MSTSRLLVVPLLAGLLIGSVLWWPARFLTGLLPPGLHCAQLAGSLWRGRCLGLSLRGSRSGDLRWQIRMPQFAAGVLPVDIVWAAGESRLQGRLSAGTGGRFQLEVASARVSLQEARDALPADISLGALAAVAGTLHTDGLTLRGVDGRLLGIRGTAVLRSTRLLRSAVELGDFAAELRDTRGTLRDLGGPLQLRGELQLDAGRYLVRARAEPRTATLRNTLGIATHIDIDVEGRL